MFGSMPRVPPPARTPSTPPRPRRAAPALPVPPASKPTAAERWREEKEAEWADKSSALRARHPTRAKFDKWLVKQLTKARKFAARRYVYFHEDGTVTVKRGRLKVADEIDFNTQKREGTAYEVTGVMPLATSARAFYAVPKKIDVGDTVWCALVAARADPHGEVLALRTDATHGPVADVKFQTSTQEIKLRFLEGQVSIVLDVKREKRNAARYVRLRDAEELQSLPERATRITPENIDVVASYQTTDLYELAPVHAAFAEVH